MNGKEWGKEVGRVFIFDQPGGWGEGEVVEKTNASKKWVLF